jgi:hypothetical protein
MDIPFVVSRVPAVQERQAAWIRANLTLADEIGLALRAVRRGCRQSQREYARARGWSPAHQGRLETRATDLGLGRVLTALEPTAFTLVIVAEASDPWPDPGPSAAILAGWVGTALRERGVTTRMAARDSGLSQATVSRLCDGDRAVAVRLGLAAALVDWFGGAMRLGRSSPVGLSVTDPQSWPTCAVIPRARGNGRRLAAHGWVRREQPWWFRWDHRPHLGMPPVWTAESPSDPRWEAEPYGNGIAPPPPPARSEGAA